MAALAAAVVVCLLALATGIAAAHDFEQPDRVLVSTTGDNSELVTALEIGSQSEGEGTVAMSLPPERLPTLADGDRLVASAEVQVTTDCRVKDPRCVGAPYDYNPKVASQLILAPGPDVAGGAQTAPVSPPRERNCVQRLPHRHHHCVVTYPGSAFDVSGGGPPCMAVGCHLNLVMRAHHPDAGLADRLIVGEDEPDGSIVQDKGRLNAVRLRPVVEGPEPSGQVRRFTSDVALVETLPVGPTLNQSRTVVFSRRLARPRAGEQLAVDARVRTDIAALGYRVLVNSLVIVTTGRSRTRVTDRAKELVDLKGELTESNGFNCTLPDTPCATRKAGVGRIIEDALDDDGEPIPLFVNLVVRTKALGAEAQPEDVLALGAGRMIVTRYPAGRSG
jgi:hypothetical protein